MTQFMWDYPATFTALVCVAMTAAMVAGVCVSLKISGGGGE